MAHNVEASVEKVLFVQLLHSLFVVKRCRKCNTGQHLKKKKIADVHLNRPTARKTCWDTGKKTDSDSAEAQSPDSNNQTEK